MQSDKATSDRHLSYEPAAVAARVLTRMRTEWPDWTVHYCRLLPPGGEKFDWAHKRISIAADHGDRDWREVHAYAHLGLRCPRTKPGRRFDPAEEDAASWLADMLLGEIGADDFED